MSAALGGPTDRALAYALGSVLASYPDQALAERLEPLLADPVLSAWLEATGWGGRLAPVLEARAPDAIDDLGCDYMDFFERTERPPLNEAGYARLRMISKTPVLGDLAAFYNAFGFAMEPVCAPEMPDHVAVELEFFAILLVKEALLAERGDLDGVEVVRGARATFLEAHLGPLARAIRTRDEVRASAAYAPVFAYIAALVDEDCAALGVDPVPLSSGGPSDTDGKEHMQCGSCTLH